MLKLVSTENLALLEDFEGIHLLVVFHLNEEHFAVAALADDFDGAEVFHADIARAGYRAIAHLFHLVDGLLVSHLLHTVKLRTG